MAIDLPGVGGGMGGGAPENDPVDTGNGGPGGSSGSGGDDDSPHGTPRLGNIPSPTFDPRAPLDPITTDAPEGTDLEAGTTIPEATGYANQGNDPAQANEPATTQNVGLPFGVLGAVAAVVALGAVVLGGN